MRSYTYVSDMVDGIYRLMLSDLEGPTNTHACGGAGAGDPEYVTVKELVDIVTEVSGKRINVEWARARSGCRAAVCDNKRHLLARLARPDADQTGKCSDVSADRGPGEGRTGEK